jgi:hypothetical protein
MGGRIRRLLGKLKGTPPLLTTGELIRLLLDHEARPSDRADAAIELGRHDDPEVEDALLGIVRDPGSSAELSEDCGLSLAEIWSRRDQLNVPLAATLPPPRPIEKRGSRFSATPPPRLLIVVAILFGGVVIPIHVMRSRTMGEHTTGHCWGRVGAIAILTFLLAAAPRVLSAQEEQRDPDLQEQMERMAPLWRQMSVGVIEVTLQELSKKETADQLATFTRNFYESLLAKRFTKVEAIEIVKAVGIPLLPSPR